MIMDKQNSIWVLSTHSLPNGRPVGLREFRDKTAIFTTPELANEYASQSGLSDKVVEMTNSDWIMQIGLKYVLNLPMREIIRRPNGDIVFHNFSDSSRMEYFWDVIKKIKGCTARPCRGKFPLSEPGLFTFKSPGVWVVNPSPEHAVAIQKLFLKSDGEFYY
jgi:hypothetical protein